MKPNIYPTASVPLPLYTTLALDDDGDVEFPPRWATELEAVAQTIQTQIAFFVGEWYLDRRRGTPWKQRGLGKHGKGSIEAMIRGMLRRCPGVVEVLSVRLGVLDPSDRSLPVVWSVRAQGGRIDADQRVPLASPSIL